jgi:hypothetical protein
MDSRQITSQTAACMMEVAATIILSGCVVPKTETGQTFLYWLILPSSNEDRQIPEILDGKDRTGIGEENN